MQSAGIFIRVKMFLPNINRIIEMIKPKAPFTMIPSAYNCSILSVFPLPNSWEHRMVTDKEITVKAIINRSMILEALAIALAPVFDTWLTMILSILATKSCSTNSIKIGQVYLSSFLSNSFILK